MAKHLRIEGIVQGVGYRAAFVARARSLQLAGWVRNRADGSVEAAVMGPAQAIDQLVAWSKLGPPAARVRNVLVSDIDESEVPSGSLEIRPTA